MKKYVIALLTLLFAAASGLAQPAAGAPPAVAGHAGHGGHRDAVLAWNEIASDVMVTSGIAPLFDPFHESRIYAMMHIAVHDALNAIKRRSHPYAVDLGRVPSASPQAAVAAAAHDVLVPALRQLPAEIATGVPAAVAQADSAYTAALAGLPDGKRKRQGVMLGRAAAAAINAMRADDGADAPFFDFTPILNPAPGDFRWVAGADFQAVTKWGDVTPFVMSSGDELRPPPPHALTSAEYAADFNELKELGSLTSTSRTASQTEIALFWFESSPMRWNRIARTVSTSGHLGMWDNARLFALLNVVEADGYIGNLEAKRFYNRWRPETAVRLADIDGNPLTVPDTGWTPTWGFSGAGPEYDSGHAIEGAGAATVLADVLGTDRVTFKVCSYSFFPPPQITTFSPENNCDGSAPIFRTYHSFSQAAEENGVSRIYLGWHFRNAVERGYEHGTQLGHLALDTLFTPSR